MKKRTRPTYSNEEKGALLARKMCILGNPWVKHFFKERNGMLDHKRTRQKFYLDLSITSTWVTEDGNVDFKHDLLATSPAPYQHLGYRGWECGF